MTAVGVALSDYAAGAFRKVPAHLARRPLGSFDLAARLGPEASGWMLDRYGEEGETDVSKAIGSIPMRLYRRLSADEMCKVRHSTMFMMDQSVEDAFETDPGLVIYGKITSSAWRWGMRRLPWNEVVDAYAGLRNFDLGHPDFEARLDHTTWLNERGTGQHSRTYLDGVFGFLVHHRGEHVMTLGFSVMAGRRLLVQQVQLRNRKGNRWLFKLPRNYLEHALARFRAAFPRHRLFVVDGGDLMRAHVRNYRDMLEREEEGLERSRVRLASWPPEEDPDRARGVQRREAEVARLRACVEHAVPEVARLDAFYSDTGRFARGEPLTVNRLRHYALAEA